MRNDRFDVVFDNSKFDIQFLKEEFQRLLRKSQISYKSDFKRLYETDTEKHIQDVSFLFTQSQKSCNVKFGFEDEFGVIGFQKLVDMKNYMSKYILLWFMD